MDRKQFLRDGLFGGLALIMPKPKTENKITINEEYIMPTAKTSTAGYVLTSIGGAHVEWFDHNGNLIKQP